MIILPEKLDGEMEFGYETYLALKHCQIYESISNHTLLGLIIENKVYLFPKWMISHPQNKNLF